MKRIILTGGGTAGHVAPNLALAPFLIERGFELHYIGTQDGIERGLVAKHPAIVYHAISSGKLRRYFDVKNFTDPLRVIKGLFESINLIRRLQPELVFSKGGFVTVPVVIGAYMNKVSVLAHESDFTPGLANRIVKPFATKILTTFPETVPFIGKKAVHTGTPLRPELFGGKRDEGLRLCGFPADKPVLMVIGGSLGAQAINQAVRGILDDLLVKYSVLHVCGKNNLDASLENKAGYRQFEYLSEELPHAYAAADVMLSRAGAGSVNEILALLKPAVLVPYPKTASRGDQILNAESFERKGLSKVLMQENITPESLLEAINDVYENRAVYIAAMRTQPHADGTSRVLNEIFSHLATPAT